MEEVYRDSWDPELGRHRATAVFRGSQECSVGLQSTLMRLARHPESAEKIERHLIRNFQKYAWSDVQGHTVWDWLAVAAHHSLPTRLLDWSFSPLVALHFATKDPSTYGVDGVIWCVNHRETNRHLPKRLRKVLESNGSDVFTVQMLSEAVDSLEELSGMGSEKFVVFLEPPSLDARIVNQFALFSITSTPDQGLDIWLEEDAPEAARKLILPADLKWEIRDKLDQAGITERMLFPGLDGLAAWLTRYYAPRPNSPQMGDND